MEQAPVNEGDIVDVRIEGIGDKGDGIGRVKGFVLIVPGTQEGDEVKVKVNKVIKNMGFAEVVERKEAFEEETEIKEEKKEKKTKPKKKEKPENLLDYDPSLDSEDFGSELD
ncbi:TRAM domain-containing protein [Candidatus Woesearchaeota archaeon]|nr:TRAM domain-containing protein [Candidatus Woesearchaeota archaeon]